MTSHRVPVALRGLALAAAVFGIAAARPAHALEAFAADYEASYMGLSAKGRMTIEPQAGNQWKYTLKVSNQVAQLTQVTVFEDRNGQWRPLSGTDASLLLIKKIRRNAVYDWSAGQARWSGDVKPERAGPVALQAGDVDALLLNLAIARDAQAGKPLRYRMVDEGRVKQMQWEVVGKETVTVGGASKQATKVVRRSDKREMYVWLVPDMPVPARVLQRENGMDTVDLTVRSVR